MNLYKRTFLRKGDIDAGIGVFFDGFSKIIIGASVLTGMVNMPATLVFGEIITATGMTALLFLFWNTLFALKTGKKTKNTMITALPGGIFSGTFFIWLYGIILPTYAATHDFILAWQVAIWANIFHSLLQIVCAFFMDFLLKYIPQQAIFSSLAGGAIAWLLLSALAEGFAMPMVILPALFILLTLYFGNIGIKGLSPAVLAILVATLIAWLAKLMSVSALKESFATIGIYFPLPHLQFLNGEALRRALHFLPLVLAFAFADAISSLQALQQAEAGGDEYSRRSALCSVGILNLLGALFGNPFVFGYYWGHPAWKEVKAGSLYTSYVGAAYFLLCLSGAVASVTALLPAAATLVLIIFAGLNTFSQAFSVNQKKYYPVMALGVAIPIFELINGKIENAVEATKTAFLAQVQSMGIEFDRALFVSPEQLAANGISSGYASMAQGSVLISMIYVAALCFIIDRHWQKAAVTFLIAAIASFFGFIHGAAIGINAAPTFTMIYLLFSLSFFAIKYMSRQSLDK